MDLFIGILYNPGNRDITSPHADELRVTTESRQNLASAWGYPFVTIGNLPYNRDCTLTHANVLRAAVKKPVKTGWELAISNFLMNLQKPFVGLVNAEFFVAELFR
jgi:hypothetical protein